MGGKRRKQPSRRDPDGDQRKGRGGTRCKMVMAATDRGGRARPFELLQARLRRVHLAEELLERGRRGRYAHAPVLGIWIFEHGQRLARAPPEQTSTRLRARRCC